MSQFQDDDDRPRRNHILTRGFGAIILTLSLIASAAAILVGGVVSGAVFGSFDALNWASLPAAAQSAYTNDKADLWIALSVLVGGIFIVGFYQMVHMIFGGGDESGQEQPE